MSHKQRIAELRLQGKHALAESFAELDARPAALDAEFYEVDRRLAAADARFEVKGTERPVNEEAA